MKMSRHQRPVFTDQQASELSFAKTSQPTNILVDCTKTSLTVNLSQSVTNISRASSSSLPTHLDGMQCALQVVTC